MMKFQLFLSFFFFLKDDNTSSTLEKRESKNFKILVQWLRGNKQANPISAWASKVYFSLKDFFADFWKSGTMS